MVNYDCAECGIQDAERKGHTRHVALVTKGSYLRIHLRGG
jgi:hypothetical protein